MNLLSLFQRSIFCLSLVMAADCAGAQEKKVAPTPAELFREIATQDSLLFAAFNRQDLKTLKTFFATDLEWYQDNGGLISYDTVFLNFETNFKKGLNLQRQLVKNSLEVHPVKNYGAIETGSHQFRHIENGKEETGTFKFLMIWKKQSDGWKITRVVSYDH